MMPENLWKRSSVCSAGGQCVEVAFHKAKASGSGMTCVEVGQCDCDGGTWHVRDSKDPGGPVLSFDASEWAAFLTGVRNGEFDGDRDS